MPYPIEMKRLMGKWRCRVRKADADEELLFFNIPINGGFAPHKRGLFRKPLFFNIPINRGFPHKRGLCTP
jgi:hypothetical protein